MKANHLQLKTKIQVRIKVKHKALKGKREIGKIGLTIFNLLKSSNKDSENQKIH